jgi:hypothetical protein
LLAEALLAPSPALAKARSGACGSTAGVNQRIDSSIKNRVCWAAGRAIGICATVLEPFAISGLRNIEACRVAR